jgi:hypothetical protein
LGNHRAVNLEQLIDDRRRIRSRTCRNERSDVSGRKTNETSPKLGVKQYAMSFANKTLCPNPQGFGVHQKAVAIKNNGSRAPIAKSGLHIQRHCVWIQEMMWRPVRPVGTVAVRVI